MSVSAHALSTIRCPAQPHIGRPGVSQQFAKDRYWITEKKERGRVSSFSAADLPGCGPVALQGHVK